MGDGGAGLSGGQRQRLAIARSIIKKPSILILDEATSAIDVRGERIVQAALDRAAKGRTTITIAHRLSTIRNADRIVVLKKGNIVESGNHESLISINGGVYSGLVNSQALSLGDSAYKDVENESDTDDLQTLTHEKTRAESGPSDSPFERVETGKPKDCGFFGSFGRFFYESRTCWGLIALSLFASAAAGTAQPLYAWLFSMSIDLFKFQDDHSRLTNEMDF